ncbi:hypothetical protein C7974DRAFT_229673 [Boeremia exigua]|uniref:uncharacterized protein n=1 Tax=Boeremia exigua TaxID=749465 RepID=UPI001E8CC88C|nr:uncharacterized protein C7974DRAFT_229673 [Boeremia exigua]KAH6620268.1 hypothetical protein C7974DRAFT_229673 [Boeremia exigua]
MTGRRSARAATKAPVKYTSDSDGSDFGEKRTKKSNKKAAQSTPKKGTKRSQPANGETEQTPKRRRKSPETLAAEHAEKSKQQEEKAAKQKAKQKWEDWLSKNDVSGKLLETEPEREDCITQTDAQKQYGLKATELVTVEHFEKPNQYGGQTKLFLLADVAKVAFRKTGILAGFGDEPSVLEKGEELWKNEHSNGAKSPPKEPKEAAPKPKTPKQKWAAYVEEHSIGDEKLSEEPEDSINQTDSKTQFQLLPADLACLPHFPKPNPKYGNTTKLFKKNDVQDLAYRKAAMVAGVDETATTEEILSKGKELLGSAEDAAET